MKLKLVFGTFLVALIVALSYTLIRPTGSKAKAQINAPLGTPESPELRNDPAKPLQVITASCLRVFDEKKPRCTAQVQFAKTGGPWSGYTIVWTLRYEDGSLTKSTWTKEGRTPDGVMPDHNHFKAGQISTIGSTHEQGVRTKDGRQLTIVNAAVEAVTVQ